jgi:RND family efflux transporter MFP subunit
MIRHPHAATAACLFGVALLAGCGGGHGAAKPDDRAPVTVSVFVVGARSGERGIVLPGRVEAREEVTLASRLAGRVTALPVAGGAAFREGDVLVRFDAPVARASLAAAEAAWNAAGTRLEIARRQESRFDSLYAMKVASLHELELVRSEAQAAAAQERAAAAARSERRAGVEILAPFTGVVVRRRVDPGAEVAPGMPLLDIRSRETGDIVVAVPEREEGRLQGGAFAIQIGDGPWRDARLARADGMVDPVSRTRTARFRPRAGAAPEAGAFARVRLGENGTGIARAAGTSTAMDDLDRRGPDATIPVSAMVRRGALAGVYIVRDGRARLRWLRLGRQAGGDVPVLAGLDIGDSVVSAPDGLTDGRLVEAAK